MKAILHICIVWAVLLPLGSLPLRAQTPPSIAWQKALGGTGTERAYALTASGDGGFVVAGYTTSTDGDVSGNHGSVDFWVVRLDASGDIVWQKALGGSDEEQALAVTASGDGGFVVAGFTRSTDGDVSGNHGNSDYWVVKLDAAGDIVWQKALGGSGVDVATALTASPDGGYIVVGYTQSTDGDVSGNHSSVDYWVVKLDAAGGIVWQKALGGTGYDEAKAITASGDGGFVVAGFTYSNDGDVSGYQGNGDYWVVKLDSLGSIVWQKALGGTGYDIANAITASDDGGFVVAGFTYSNDGDVSGNHGNSDYWVVKLDSLGSIVWQKALGGTSSDQAYAITASDDGGFVVAGFTESNNGDVAENHGNADYWVVRLDSLGGIVWQKALGGTDYDDAFAITASDDGGFVVAGFTTSNDGDVSGYHGNADYWVVRLSGTAPTVSGLSASPSPVCAGQSVQFTATVGNFTGSYDYTLTNGAGSTLTGTSSVTAFTQSLTASGTGSQTYTLTVTTAGGADSTTTTLTVNPLPTASITGNNGPVCAGGDASFTVSGTSGATLTYTLTGLSGNQTLLLNGGSQTILASGATSNATLTLVSVADANCSQNLMATSTVTVNPLPDASFTGLSGPYCANAAAVTLSPATPGGTFSGPGVAGSTFTPADAGSGGTIMYSVTANGCSSSSTQSVTVRPAITLNTSPNTSVVYGYGSSCTTLTASASGGTGNIGLSWSTGATGTSTQVCPTQTTTYTVTATDAAGCSVQKQITVTVDDVRCGYGGVKVCLGGREQCIAQYLVPTYLRLGYSLGGCNTQVPARIGYEPQEATPPSLALTVRAYPNPTSGTLNVEVYSPVATSARLQVLDAAGRPVQQRAVELSEGLNPREFDLRVQPAGNYLIRCVDALGRQAVVRVNKQ